MLGLGLALFAALYYLKTGPQLFAPTVTSVEITTEPVEIETVTEPALPTTVIEQVQIPDWLENKGEYDLSGLTVDDLWQFAVTAHEQDHDFYPHQQNALFYLLQAQQAGLNTPESQGMMTDLQARLYTAADQAIAQYNTKKLTDLTARLKTINATDPKIQEYTQQIGTFMTLERLANQAKKQLIQGLIETTDHQDLIRTIQTAEQLDLHYPEILFIKEQAVIQLTEQAYQSADENDYDMAQEQLQLAETIDSSHPEITATREAINQQKQDRFIYLDQQFHLAINRLNINRATELVEQLKALQVQDSQLISYQNLLEKVSTFGHLEPFDNTSDRLAVGQSGPEMVVMPKTEFIMGNSLGPSHQRPEHRVVFAHAFAIAKTEITVAEFRLFIESSGYTTSAEQSNLTNVYDINSGRFKQKHGINWRHDYLGKKADDDLPVIHISHTDARAYARWLAAQSGQDYRLPSESEFEFALGMGNDYIYPWGNKEPEQVMGNFSGAKDKLKRSRVRWREGFSDYQDGYWGPAPTGSFIPNLYGLQDMSGNVMEWVDDCWHDSYTRAPNNGIAWVNPGCENRVIRGGHWASAQSDYQIHHRLKAQNNFHDPRLGFRVAKTIKVN